ncbi:MAG: hypothetical protein PHR36_04440 [Patescibacteria group bacterium]|nr:hypothetical protein [Patescibacteria group bacterium]
MQGIEKSYCDACINAVIGAWRGLMEVYFTEALRKVGYGKGDTLGLDAIPEIRIINRLTEFDPHAILITEERDDNVRRSWPTDADPIRQPLMFFSDPTDRSIELEKYFQRLSQEDPMAKIGVLMNKVEKETIWEEVSKEAPAIITGPTTSITCVRKGNIIFSVILNYVTSTIIVATDIGIIWYRLKAFDDPDNEKIVLDEIIRKGQRLNFPSVKETGYTSDDCMRFVTFLGKSGYRENFNDSMLFVENPDNFIHHKTPPGPPRVLYLSEFQKGHNPVGFVLANGEKIGEWLPWLSFVKFAKNGNGHQALRIFEISLERPWTKYGMLMSPSLPYSLFCENNGRSYLDMSRLRNFDRPSQFRSMLVVLPCDNERIIGVLLQLQYRDVTNFF